MTTTPTDLGALTALEQAATPAPWAHEHDGGHIVHGPDGTVAEAMYAPDAKLIAAMRNALPALLDELATERRQGAAMASITGEAIRQLGEERDAAREELAKTRAELDAAKAAQAKVRAETLLWAADRIDPGPSRFWPEERSQTWDDSLATRRGVAANLRFWVDRGYLGPLADANPATTAEPADEPKARREPKLKRADIFDEILAYPCPSCGVSAGTVCVNRDRRFSHIKRRTLAGANAEPAAS